MLRFANSEIPTVRVDVVEPGTRARKADFRCLIGRDLELDPELLGSYCVRDIDSAVDDLVLLAGAIAFTDRVVPRRISIAWRRNLSLVVPVHAPDMWTHPSVHRRLTQLLDLLTGDNWNFEFK